MCHPFMKNHVVKNIHGCYFELQRLLEIPGKAGSKEIYGELLNATSKTDTSASGA
jgi:hypothetical protein